jgi:hypothetical protein
MRRQQAIQKLRAELRRKAVGKGTTCPLCSRHTQVYKRTLRWQTTLWLMALLRIWLKERRWIHCGEVENELYAMAKAGPWRTRREGRRIFINERWQKTFHGDYAYMKHWDFIRSKGENPPGSRTKSSGYYKPLKPGYEFVKGEIEVASFVVLFYRDEILEWSEDFVDVGDTLTEDFDYQKLLVWMRRTP